MSTLHITNGDCAADLLRQFVDGPVTITADALHEGPAPRVDGDAWHDVRARYPAADDTAYEEMRADLAAGDGTIAEACRWSPSLSGERHEIVLWFEHDLFDQLLLIRTLDLLVRLKADTTGTSAMSVIPVVSGFSRTRTSTRVSLICIDRFPGVERFIGLGQLTADQLASLYPSRRPVTPDQFALATSAWDAFRAPHPAELLALASRLLGRAGPAPADDCGAGTLPFLGAALDRFFQEFPSTTNGLSRTEELALRALSAGPMTAGSLFAATQAQEARPFMGDLTFYRIVRALASAPVPLVAMGAPAQELDLGLADAAITDAGRDVLAGRRDHIALNGIDLWRGGVHLAGRDRSPWRWDAHGETLVS